MMKLYRLLILFSIITANAQSNYKLIVGTYTNECESEGMYIYDYNATDGGVKLKGSSKGVINPSFLTVSTDRKYIYSVNENGTKSTISSFKYIQSNDKIELINKKDAEGIDPCHIITDDTNVVVANYSDGAITVFGKKGDGSLANPKQVIKHKGSSIAPQQKSPHIHMVQFSPDNKYVIATDLGADKMYVYNYNPKGDKETLVLKEVKDIKAGSGPRHFVFNPNGVFVYLLQELDATLTVFYYNDAKMETIQEISVAPQDTDAQNSAADIHITKDGKFLYATNRGEVNSITVFQVHANGKLSKVQQLPTGGVAPRNFAIDPDENFVLVANQKSNNIVIFKRDKTTGMLSDTGNRVEVCQPVCLVFTDSK
ncbi:lactonase family protein [Flavobacterium salilacus subsp. salilacus]|uniref:lactonase family protein n=1 Tax=Flavobacterium TaxID=237 RepID=UPI001074A279|nr:MULTISPECIES: lactonase family protein [Flavobacterium]KAF2518680.1 lactonase family protein [Flavobacterium salilacus subsp. salilacus]MBE1613643.1 lactonase family protein [Flavobacterium sp. SaA2.13]